MKHWTPWIAACALTLAACSKSEDKKPQADKPGTESATKKPEAKTEAKTEPPAAAKPAVELFTGSAPALPPPVDKLAIGMPAAEAKGLAPAVFEAKYGYKVPGYAGVEVNVQLTKETERIYVVRIELDQPIETVKTALAAKWGEPRATKNSIGAAEYYWDHPASGIRAKLEGRATNSQIIFGSVMSTQQLIGTTPGRLGFEKQPLIGATKDEVLAAYATWGARAKDGSADQISIPLPPLDTSQYPGFVTAKLKDGKVSGYTAQVSFSWEPATKQALLTGLETLFGKPKAGDMYTDFPGPPKVKVDHSSKDQLVIWVADYK